MLSTLCQYYPEDSLQRLEEVSYLIKSQNLIAMEEFIKVEEQRIYARHNDTVAMATKKQVADLTKLLDVSFNFVKFTIMFCNYFTER